MDSYSDQYNGEEHGTVSVVDSMRRAWLNEQHCPEFLPYMQNLVEQLKGVLDKRQAEIDSVGNHNLDDYLTANIMQTELERIVFMLRSYFRVRLWKIQKHPALMQERINEPGLLSVSEQGFLNTYIRILEGHLENSFTADLPDMLKAHLNRRSHQDETAFPQPPTAMDPHSISEPNLDQFVLVEALEDCFALELNDNALDAHAKHTLHKGEKAVLRYRKVAEYMNRDHLQLI
eukprot:Clim_evm24s143 gene=Clim_evmTU24s143